MNKVYASGEPHPDNPFRVGDRVFFNRGKTWDAVGGTVENIAGLVINVKWDNGAAMGTSYYPRDLVLASPPFGVPLNDETAKLLRVGDVAFGIGGGSQSVGFLFHVVEDTSATPRYVPAVRVDKSAGVIHWFLPHELRFLGRPDADGWMPYTAIGDLDPTLFEFKMADGGTLVGSSWVELDNDRRDSTFKFTHFRLVHRPAAAEPEPPVRTIADIAKDLRPIRIGDIKPGDKVLLKTQVLLGLNGLTVSRNLRDHEIIAHEPATPSPLKVGDCVCWPRTGKAVGAIRAIDDEQGEAWVRWKSGGRNYSTVRLSELVRS